MGECSNEGSWGAKFEMQVEVWLRCHAFEAAREFFMGRIRGRCMARVILRCVWIDWVMDILMQVKKRHG